MFKILNILIIIISILMIGFILLQESREGIMPSSVGKSSVHRIGFKQKTSLLERLTWGLIISILTLSLITSLVIQKMTHHKMHSPNITKAAERGFLLEDAKDPTPEKTKDRESKKEQPGH